MRRIVSSGIAVLAVMLIQTNVGRARVMTDGPKACSSDTNCFDVKQAKIVALKEIRKQNKEHDFLIREQFEEREFGWVFYYTTAKYEMTGESGFAIPGVGPVAVTRKDRKVHFLPTSIAPEKAINAFEKAWQKAQKTIPKPG